MQGESIRLRPEHVCLRLGQAHALLGDSQLLGCGAGLEVLQASLCHVHARLCDLCLPVCCIGPCDRGERLAAKVSEPIEQGLGGRVVCTCRSQRFLGCLDLPGGDLLFIRAFSFLAGEQPLCIQLRLGQDGGLFRKLDLGVRLDDPGVELLRVAQRITRVLPSRARTLVLSDGQCHDGSHGLDLFLPRSCPEDGQVGLSCCDCCLGLGHLAL